MEYTDMSVILNVEIQIDLKYIATLHYIVTSLFLYFNKMFMFINLKKR
jgi:hypothetical protein